MSFLKSDIYNLDEISDYLYFHDTIDSFVWLIKLMYSPKGIIKSKQYRISTLFQYYIKNNVDFNKLNNLISNKSSNPERFIYFLKQGWYDEFSINYPYNYNKDILNSTLLLNNFDSWTVIKTYYSIYEFYNALLFTNVDRFNTFSHRNSTNHFNNTLLSKFSKSLLQFPFNISISNANAEIKKFRDTERKEWGYAYSLCPRQTFTTKVREEPLHISINKFDTLTPDEQKTIIDRIKNKQKTNNDFYHIENYYYDQIKQTKEDLKTKSTVNIVDFMYSFRIWSNYTGFETFVKLQEGGYTSYLQKNLSLLNYFFAGFAEIMAIAFLGEEKFYKEFLAFYNSLILGKNEIQNNWHNISLINRIMIYEHFGFLSKNSIKDLQPNKLDIIFV